MSYRVDLQPKAHLTFRFEHQNQHSSKILNEYATQRSTVMMKFEDGLKDGLLVFIC